MKEFEVSRLTGKRQAAWPSAGVLAAVSIVLAIGSCAAPISTMRSPYHLRVVEVRNLTPKGRTLTIEPTAGQHLGAATTFTGLLRPGEIKVLYLYHGFEYEFRLLPPEGGGEPVRGVFDVERDLGLAYSGDSLIPDGRVVADLVDPAATFADSLQDLDPFGLRSRRTIEPDTSRGHDLTPVEEQQRGRRGGSGRNP